MGGRYGHLADAVAHVGPQSSSDASAPPGPRRRACTIGVEVPVSQATTSDGFSIKEIDRSSGHVFFHATGRDQITRIIAVDLQSILGYEGDLIGFRCTKLDESGFRRVMYAPGGWSGVAGYERVG